MSIGLIVILIVTFALVVGPISMMRPSAAQKAKENLRLLARAKGVHYSMRKIPRQADELAEPAALPVYFLSPAKNQTAAGWMLVRTNYKHDLHFLGEWAWQNTARPSNDELERLKQSLPSLPDSIRALSSGSEGVCIFWSERGGEPVLQQIIGVLESLKHAAELNA